MRERFPDQVDDTPAAVREVIDAAYRGMTPADKLERARQLSLAVTALALEGARLRQPGAARGELLADLGRLRLGEPLARAAGLMHSREP